MKYILKKSIRFSNKRSRQETELKSCRLSRKAVELTCIMMDYAENLNPGLLISSQVVKCMIWGSGNQDRIPVWSVIISPFPFQLYNVFIFTTKTFFHIWQKPNQVWLLTKWLRAWWMKKEWTFMQCKLESDGGNIKLHEIQTLQFYQIFPNQ